MNNVRPLWHVLYKMMKEQTSLLPLLSLRSKQNTKESGASGQSLKRKQKWKANILAFPIKKINIFSDYKNIFSDLLPKQHTYFLHSLFPILSKSTVLSIGSKLISFYGKSILLFKNKVNMLIKCITNQLHTKDNILSLAGHHFLYILTFKIH